MIKIPMKFLMPAILLLASTTLLPSCSGNKEEAKKADRFEVLISYIEQNHDFINSEYAPANQDIADFLNTSGTILFIDLRSAESYEKGHIDGAVNIIPSALLDYFENQISPEGFDTIALLSDDGQDAVFCTALLRMLGYNNVFGVRWGMAWHTDFSAVWKSKLSSEYESVLSFDASPEPAESGKLPEVLSEVDDGATLLRERVKGLLNSDFSTFKITAKEIFTKPQDYYVICYWTEKAYQAGHISGSYFYEQKKSLGRNTLLKTLPADKPIVLYCNSGHHSAAAAAYLRLLGYDARSLSYGTNSFMYNIHKEKIEKGLYSEDVLLEYRLRKKGEEGKVIEQAPVKVKPAGGGC
jgi:rhodanese-related sulfurtransferase